MATIRPEYPPLYGLGPCRTSLESIGDICVARFPTSDTRAKLFEGLQQFAGLLAASNLTCELWVDGSFVTEKLDPKDVDCVLWVRTYDVLPLTFEQKLLVQEASNGIYRGWGLDLYVELERSPTDKYHSQFMGQKRYWENQWGHDRNNARKGFAVIGFGGRI